jgi:hypothetical protein
MHRVTSSLRRGQIPSTWRGGGVQWASQTLSASWTRGSAAPGVSSCAPPLASNILAGVYREIVGPERLVFTNIATILRRTMREILSSTGSQPSSSLSTAARRSSLCKRALSPWSPMQPHTLQGWRRAGRKAWSASPKSWRDPKAFANCGKKSLNRILARRLWTVPLELRLSVSLEGVEVRDWPHRIFPSGCRTAPE